MALSKDEKKNDTNTLSIKKINRSCNQVFFFHSGIIINRGGVRNQRFQTGHYIPVVTNVAHSRHRDFGDPVFRRLCADRCFLWILPGTKSGEIESDRSVAV